MTARKTHDEAFAELDAVAFDIAEPAERDAVLQHVEECEECRTELDAMRATAASLAFAAPPVVDAQAESRGGIRSRLMLRATAEAQARRLANPPLVFPKSAPAPAPAELPMRTKWRWVEWLAAAASLLLVATLGLLAYSFAEQRRLSETLASETSQVILARRASDSLAALVATRDSLIAGITGRNVSVMTLTSASAPDAVARMFWDRTRNSWMLIARNMPALGAGRTYQIWLVTPKAKISAGTFDPASGEMMKTMMYPLADSLMAIAVTEEPAGGMPQPTGTVVMSSAAPK
jgi:hypothetical protein